MKKLLLLLILILSACVSVKAPIEKKVVIAPDNISVQIEEKPKKIVEDFTIDSLYSPVFDVDGYLFADKKLALNYEYVIKSKKYDLPIIITPRVKFYLDLYSKRYPSTFQKYLERSNKYIYLVKDILKREGLPTQLAILPLAESGYNTNIYSRAGAGGMWQFMPSTGKIYGLKINFWIDERRDFEKATIAAVKHLKYLYKNLGDWYLAIAAYNAGFYKVYYGVKKYKTNDFFKLAKKRYLKKETKDYVPKFIALSILYYNYLEYGFETPTTSPLFYEKINLNQPVNLYVIAEILNTDIDTLKELNPDLKKPITPPDDKYSLKIPYGTKNILAQKIAKMSPNELLKVKIYKARAGEYISKIAKKFGVSKNNIMKVNSLRYSKVLYNTYLFIPIDDFMKTAYANDFIKDVRVYAPKVHIVKRGESLYSIAHKYGLSVYDILRYNSGINPRLIHPGQPIVISKNYKKRYSYKKKTYRKKRKLVNGKYTVKSGDTLWDIATDFKISIKELMKKNNLKTAKIKPGKKLIIY